jgi:hypothetical protein
MTPLNIFIFLGVIALSVILAIGIDYIFWHYIFIRRGGGGGANGIM